MKPITASACGLAIAVVSASIGYRAGKSGSQQLAPRADAPAATRPTASGPAGRSRGPAPDLSGFAAELDRIDDPLARFSLALDAMESWVAQEPARALAWLQSQPASARRNEVIRLAIAQWAENDPMAAAGWTQDHLSGIDLHNAMIRIAERWASTDPAAAAQWFAALPEGNTRAAPLEGLFFAWANTDPKGARTFLDQQLAGDPLLPTLTRAVLAGWAKTDPTEACAASLETSRTTRNPGLFANTVANWATVDVRSSSDWLFDKVPPGPERSAAVGEIAGIYAHQDPASTAAWITELPAPERPVASRVLAEEWARIDPAAAAAWLASSARSGEVDEATVEAVVAGFLTASPMEFDAWRESLPQGPLRNQVTVLATPQNDSE